MINTWKLNAIMLHHRTIRSWIVMMRSQSHFVFWKILSVFGLLAAITADSLSHNDHTDHICMVPARNNAPRTASPGTRPPSSNLYEVIIDWIPLLTLGSMKKHHYSYSFFVLAISIFFLKGRRHNRRTYAAATRNEL
jgi:hypothetical protein